MGNANYLKEIAKIAFEAGVRRGRDEIKGPETYAHERTVPDFDDWWKLIAKHLQLRPED